MHDPRPNLSVVSTQGQQTFVSAVKALLAELVSVEKQWGDDPEIQMWIEHLRQSTIDCCLYLKTKDFERMRRQIQTLKSQCESVSEHILEPQIKVLGSDILQSGMQAFGPAFLWDPEEDLHFEPDPITDDWEPDPDTDEINERAREWREEE